MASATLWLGPAPGSTISAPAAQAKATVPGVSVETSTRRTPAWRSAHITRSSMVDCPTRTNALCVTPSAAATGSVPPREPANTSATTGTSPGANRAGPSEPSGLRHARSGSIPAYTFIWLRPLGPKPTSQATVSRCDHFTRPRVRSSAAAMDRTCFLFNHDQLHQVAHSLPIALALAKRKPGSITLAVTTEKTERHVRDLCGASIDECNVVRLGLESALSRGLETTLEGLMPARKLAVYRENLDFFRGFDALVVSEKTSLLLKTRYGLDHLRIVHTRHGAGDRAIGFGPDSALFDLTLVSGPKVARRLVAEAGADPARVAVVGYPKFDIYADNTARSEEHTSELQSRPQ